MGYLTLLKRQKRSRKYIRKSDLAMNQTLKKTLIFTEHEDGRRGGEIARTVLWNSEFVCINIDNCIAFMIYLNVDTSLVHNFYFSITQDTRYNTELLHSDSKCIHLC